MYMGSSLTRLDDDARGILIRVKKSLADSGIQGATFSDAVRVLDNCYRADDEDFLINL